MKKMIMISISLILIVAPSLLAEMNLNLKTAAISIDNKQFIEQPIVLQSRDACQLTEFNGNPTCYNQSGFYTGYRVVEYFNPEDCGSDTTHPFQITSLDFLLYDDNTGIQWPVLIDIVVYDTALAGYGCIGPGSELCRFSIICDEATFSHTVAYPTMGTAVFPEPCCVEGSFFIGIDYVDPGTGKLPSIMFDDNTYPDTCNNWLYHPDHELWFEWYYVWSSMCGYPMWWVNGETNSANCGWVDSDGDSIADYDDNCPYDYNPGQADGDGDEIGDLCDNCPSDTNFNQVDSDSDDVGNVCDNCPDDANTDQADSDNDGIGDVCDNCPIDSNSTQADSDGDDVGDICDNCPDDANSNQADSDGDTLGDVCDNCPDDYNTDQADSDGDGIGNVCDNCPDDYNPGQGDADEDSIGDACDSSDTDGDTYPDYSDNCPADYNPDQADSDGDGIGDVCDGCEYLPGDINMFNGLWPPMVIGGDVTYLVNYFKGSGDACLLDGFWCSADANGDCIVMGSDVIRLVAYFRGAGEIEYCVDYEPAWLTSDDLPVDAPDGWPNCD